MGKFDRAVGATSTLTSPVTAAGVTTTHEDAPAFSRDVKGDLFLLAVTNMVGEDTFYESAADRDSRFRDLLHAATAEDPNWVKRFIPWLRDTAQMRTASVVAAVEYAAAGGPFPRAVIDAACQRADEPAEILAYVKLRGYRLSKGIKRGVADACARLYTERSALKYDGAARTFRMGDVIELAHAVPGSRPPDYLTTEEDDEAEVTRVHAIHREKQSDLFRWLIGRCRGRDGLRLPESLTMITSNIEMWTVPEAERRAFLDSPEAPELLRRAGMTWEALSRWVGGEMDAAAWTAIIPSMGYMALLRNLANFDKAVVSDDVAEQVAKRLADPEQVATSRQFPFRFWSAYAAAPSSRWSHALDKALDAAAANVPGLPGRSLVLVDTSASMTSRTLSARSKITPAVAAAVFGVTIARRSSADLVGFADGTFHHLVPEAASALRTIEKFLARTGEVGHGTRIAGAAQVAYAGHARVFILSDMQTMDRGLDTVIPAAVPVYGFNLGGYAATPLNAGRGNRHEFGGLTDATFRQVALLEAHRSAGWPF